MMDIAFIKQFFGDKDGWCTVHLVEICFGPDSTIPNKRVTNGKYKKGSAGTKFGGGL
jgi:hypothetical protein